MATEDILINDGDGFVSLSELAAEQVDVALPISSTDGTRHHRLPVCGPIRSAFGRSKAVLALVTSSANDEHFGKNRSTGGSNAAAYY